MKLLQIMPTPQQKDGTWREPLTRARAETEPVEDRVLPAGVEQRCGRPAGTGGGFLLGVGSNQDPAQRLPLALNALVHCYGSVLVSRVYETAPEGPQAQAGASFFNLALYLRSPLDVRVLKQRLNALEERLGRDRRHPLRHRRPVPIDLDILLGPLDHAGSLPAPMCADSVTIQSYLQRPVHEILAALDMARGITPSAPGLTVCLDFSGNCLLGRRPVLLSLSRTGVVAVDC